MMSCVAGTGHDAMVLKRNDLAGKTGSTNDHRDGWFNGYNDDMVASAWSVLTILLR